jgi:glucan phosphoethanolaminetransferase (alkaline phosphatase superfamily)
MNPLDIEHNFFVVISFSLLLVTTSLIFFHMTVLKTVELPKIFAKVFSITLILMSCIYNGIALYQYHQRMLVNQQNDNNEIHEKVYWYFYVVLGIIFMIIEFLICLVMIGKLKNWKFI